MIITVDGARYMPQYGFGAVERSRGQNSITITRTSTNFAPCAPFMEAAFHAGN
jgi:hypothetical protein